MRSNMTGSVMGWFFRQVNWGFFLSPKGLAILILAIGGCAVWFSVGNGDHGRELISLSRPWFGQSDNRAEEHFQDSVIGNPEPAAELGEDLFAENQLLDQLRTMPVIVDQPQKQTQDEKWVTVRMRVTGYCACSKCCGKDDGITANMHRIRPGDVLVAADKKFHFGTQMMIPGYNDGQPVKVMDRGRVIKGNRLDLFFHSHAEAKKFGVKYMNVRVKVG